MELKTYQKEVLGDLERYLELMVEKQDPAKAYQALWNEKNVLVGFGGMPNYVDALGGVPHVCAKVPTGGGKTYIAASSLRTIFDAMPQRRAKAVVWLVPSDAILTQTYQAFNNPDHPYRERLEVDFGGRVQVYSKDQALMGQNLTPSAVTEQLSLFILTYDSFRTSNKEGRKAYRENGYLAEFAKWMDDPSVLLADADETALIQVIRHLNPVVIVDESHHATSDLSVGMLQDFNPCFVFDLTATPKAKSNIIAFVDAAQLKKADMVKLPVIVYNRKSQEDVYADAYTIRNKLEAQAKWEQEQNGGNYIRPIVLFQAQPRNSEDSTTYEKIKKTLMDAGIPEREIAIKTGDKDELKKVNLLSPECPIRYIITVNALKEGWDCPFAYVLATVANRSSAVDVEQILGRVLRLPYTRKNTREVLNLSYVITSSADFTATVDKVVKGLNSAGFSSQDCRVQDTDSTNSEAQVSLAEQLPLAPLAADEPDMPEVNGADLKTRFTMTAQEIEHSGVDDALQTDPMLEQALRQNQIYEDEIDKAEKTTLEQAPLEVRDKMNRFPMNEEFAEETAALQFPQFMLETGPSLFSDPYETLEKEHLEGGFTLRDKDAHVDFTAVKTEMALVDVKEGKNIPQAWLLSGGDSAFYREWFNSQPTEKRLSLCKGIIKKRLSKRDCVNDRELDGYIDRVIDTMDEDQLTELEQSPYPYVNAIKDKVESIIEQHRINQFNLWLEQDRIVCRPNYVLPAVISPTEFNTMVPKSLYSAEEKTDTKYEFDVIWALSALDNVKWWHRNISKRGFLINGPVYAYPDIIVMLKSGKILMVETKGDHLDNAESKEKARIGDQWANLAGKQYKYYMVFQTKQPDYPGAYSLERFMEIVKGL